MLNEKIFGLVKESILIENVIDGNNTEVYVEFKGRSSRFLINEELGNSINKWLNNLTVITVNEIKEVNYRDKYYLAGNIKPSLNYDKKTINQFSSSADYLKISKIKKVLNMKFVNYIENNELIFNLLNFRT